MTVFNKENFLYFFQHNAKKLRRKSGLTQHQLAEQLSITQKTLAAIEEGRSLGIENLSNFSPFA